jgi:hypothetical protein
MKGGRSKKRGMTEALGGEGKRMVVKLVRLEGLFAARERRQLRRQVSWEGRCPVPCSVVEQETKPTMTGWGKMKRGAAGCLMTREGWPLLGPATPKSL